MYEPMRVQFYDFVTGLINIVTRSNLWWIVSPFVIMGIVLWVIRWAVASAKGERLDNLGLDVEDSIVQTRTMASPGYYELRRQGFSTREIAHLRRQQPGNAVYSRSTQRQLSHRRLRIK